MQKSLICYKKFGLIALILFVSLPVGVFAQSLDLSFKPAISGAGGGGSIRLQLPDGRFVVIGDFRVIGGIRRNFIAILNSDETVDTSFDAGEFTTNVPQSTGYVGAVDAQSDGKLIIDGSFTHINGVATKSFIRLNTNGAVDPSFNIGQGANSSITHFKVLPSGKILVGGYFSTFNGQTVPPLIRLNPDGSLDQTFFAIINGLHQIDNFVVQPDGKIIAAGDIFSIPGGQFQGIVRLNENGSVDNSFNPGMGVNNYIGTMLLQPDGKVLIGGDFTTYNGINRTAAARINSNGSLDTSFTADTTLSSFPSIPGFAVQDDGKIIITGGFDVVNSIARKRIARLNTDGSVDQTFTPVVDANDSIAGYVSRAFILPNQKIIVSGDFYVINGTPKFGMARLNTDGTIDPSFTLTAKGIGYVYALASQPDGKILVGGLFAQMNGTTQFGIARINPDGTIDPTFNSGAGLLNINGVAGNSVVGWAYAIAVQTDGKIILGGNFAVYNNVPRFCLVRLNSDGTLDTSFQNSSPVGTVYDIRVQPDNNILIAGNGGLRRFTPNGTPDASFNTGVINDTVDSILLQPDGKMILGGSFTRINGITRNRIARVNSNGSLDTGFDTSVGASSFVDSTALQADGKILICGSFTSINGVSRNRIARLNSDGTVDSTFDPGSGADSSVRIVKIVSDKILIGGTFNNVAGVPQKRLARLFTNGSLDTSFVAMDWFAPETLGASIYAFLKTNSSLIVGGNFTNTNNQRNSSLAKLNMVRAPFDFDGDGKTDLSIFRPSVGEWWYLKSSDGGNAAAQFGASSDKITPGDFTGDGKTDIAFWRPSNGFWFVLRSEDFSYYSFPFGTTGDIPAVGDFDGDGKTDATIFRASTGTWYISKSSGGTLIQQFGQNGDVPVVSDYDGDGKADIAIYRVAVGEWWIQRSTAGLIAFQFGNSADKPVQGDFTGDGKADVALFRPSSGEWFVLRSEDQSYYSFPFGTSGDVPAPGDYDGDGKFDAAVFRPSSSTWYAQRSTAGTLIQTFGQSGDTPVPSAFIP